MRIGPETGRLLLRTRREGFASGVGHDLTIEVTRWSAEITPWPAEDRAATKVTATIQMDSLTVRAGDGGAMPLTDKDRAEIEATARRLLGTAPAGFTSTRVTPAGDGGVIEGNLTLPGVTRPVRLTVRAEESGYRATATIAQTAFGVKPYSAFLGALEVRDEVEIEVRALALG